MTINIIIIILMIAFTAFFVASEFSLVKIRKSRLETLEAEGNKKAKLAIVVVEHLDSYLSACQLGITLTSLAIGWVGESTMHALLSPVMAYLPFPKALSESFSIVLAFLLITFVHVVIGELIPKSLSISKTEAVVLAVVKPLHYFYKITYPFVWLLNVSASSVGKLFNLSLATEGEETHSEEELLLIANQSYVKGEINEKEYEYLNKVFEFDDLLAKEIMVSRLDMEVISSDTSIKEALEFAIEKGHTRFPVIRKSKDNILGYVTLQSLIKEYLSSPAQSVNTIVQEPIVFIDTIPVKVLLSEMQSQHKHFAILSDEYGGTSGLVTIEDILEELVGDIQDEQDHEEDNIVEVKENVYHVKGKTPLSEIEERFHVQLSDLPSVNTISGYVSNSYLEQREEAEVGSVRIIKNLEITILEMDRVTPSELQIRVLSD
ncbi:MAG TPA: HlyC/CorC family transporter [Lactococcus sp.]|uniref:Hemolysin family protein n=1 Tax=Lactococcus muris TaxID=2941330 RepID=A0ABV4D984_9LACT|nr:MULTISPECIES: hemolysin family protein [Lactococcus]HBC90831.1 HlyC/CorC family transporter [Lactococcus sp.]